MLVASASRTPADRARTDRIPDRTSRNSVMHRRRLDSRPSSHRRCSSSGAAATGAPARARASNTSRPTTPSTNTASRCATACGCSPPSMFPRTSRSPIRSCSCATPYSVEPYGVDQYKADLGPSPLFGKAATSSSTRTCAAAGCRKASSSTCGRTAPQEASPQDIDESSDTYDTIDWLLKNVPEPQRQGRACGASPTPASTPPPA